MSAAVRVIAFIAGTFGKCNCAWLRIYAIEDNVQAGAPRSGGPADMVIVFPTQQVYPVGEHVPHSLQDVIKSWELEADCRRNATLAETWRVEAEAHRDRDARSYQRSVPQCDHALLFQH